MAAETTLRAPLSGGVTRRHFSWLVGSLIVAGGALPKGQTRPGPALWLAEKQDTRVYLFGQMPVRSDTVWLTPEIEAAFNGSDRLVGEPGQFADNPRGDECSWRTPKTADAGGRFFGALRAR